MCEPHRLTIAYDAEGRVDAVALEKALLPNALAHELERWIRLRLAGEDPYVADSPHSDVLPWELFAGLWRRSADGSPLRGALALAMEALLDEAPDDDPLTAELLEIIADTRPMSCWPRLRSMVRKVARSGDACGADMWRSWLRAAARYPAERNGELLVEWQAVAVRPPYTAIAWSALCTQPFVAVLHLPGMAQTWTEDREELVSLYLADLLHGRDVAAVLDAIRDYRDHFASPSWLLPQIGCALASAGFPVPAPTRQAQPERNDQPSARSNRVREYVLR